MTFIITRRRQLQKGTVKRFYAKTERNEDVSFNSMWFVGKKMKENAFKISLYHLHPLAICSAEVIHFQSNLIPNSKKILHSPQNSSNCKWLGLGVIQVSIFERLLLQGKTKAVNDVSVLASLTGQPSLMLASPIAFWMGWNWAEELHVKAKSRKSWSQQ